MLGHGEPIRVKAVERVLLHVLNGSATETRSLALPGHVFKVVALDGNPVPTSVDVPVLWIGTGERVSTLVTMNNPGVWILGDVADDDRTRGMGVVVEYAGRKGKTQWTKPRPSRWDYQWAINDVPFSVERMEPMFRLREGRRYRLRMRNASDDIHPIHLHRHSFELTKIAGKNIAGVIKDVVMLGGYQEMQVSFAADNPGLTLFHCHQQMHMDYGFMALFDYL
jgi:FtsP/CotA-like multicopper oxidase with cupredoxin domain